MLISVQALRALAAWVVVCHHFMQIFFNFHASGPWCTDWSRISEVTDRRRCEALGLALFGVSWLIASHFLPFFEHPSERMKLG